MPQARNLRGNVLQLEGEVRWHDGVGRSEAQGAGAGEQQAQEAVGRVDAGQGGASGSAKPKVVSPQAKREAVRTLMTERSGSPSGNRAESELVNGLCGRLASCELSIGCIRPG
ncbi:hypothetical protein L496_2698 [Bordetella holmesii CDC-H572-BH]|nr:hypothetical protein L496_2698 [Bordetella holmesii CDC-H572-BH]